MPAPSSTPSATPATVSTTGSAWPSFQAPAPSGVIWRRHWARIVFPGVWLAYLGQVAHGVSQRGHGTAADLAYAGIVAFALCYMALIVLSMGRKAAAALVAVMVALVVAVAFVAQADTWVMLIYLTVVVLRDRRTWAVLTAVGLAAVATLVPPAIPSWHSGYLYSAGFTILVVALAMFGFFTILDMNRQLAEARAEVARLAAVNERSRIARDLHDVLGHSLTTIAVKAGLARRLSTLDPSRAAAEIAEVEQLTRDTLGEVRAAVGGFREVTLAGELSTGREVLRAAGIDLDVPATPAMDTAADDELFGWVVREALTNVVRHGRATRVTVQLTPRSVTIVDDGVGRHANTRPGNGLNGLRERVEAAGGTLQAGPRFPNGWQVRAELPDPPAVDGWSEQPSTAAATATPSPLSSALDNAPTQSAAGRDVAESASAIDTAEGSVS